MGHRIGLSGRTAAGEVLLAPAVDVDTLRVRRRRVEVCACRKCKTARDQQAGSRPGSVVLHDVCLLENNRFSHTSAARSPARNVMLCTSQRRPSNPARQPALNVTNIEIESSQKRTTGEAIYADE